MHNFGNKKITKKIQSLDIYRDLGIGTPWPKVFFVFIEKYEVSKSVKKWAHVPTRDIFKLFSVFILSNIFLIWTYPLLSLVIFNESLFTLRNHRT